MLLFFDMNTSSHSNSSQSTGRSAPSTFARLNRFDSPVFVGILGLGLVGLAFSFVATWWLALDVGELAYPVRIEMGEATCPTGALECTSEVVIQRASSELAMASAAAATLIIVASAYVLIQLIGLVHSITGGGGMFNEANLGRLTRAQWGSFALFIAFIVGSFIQGYINGELGNNVTFEFNLLPIAAIGTFGVLTAAWRRGIELADLDEHTV